MVGWVVTADWINSLAGGLRGGRFVPPTQGRGPAFGRTVRKGRGSVVVLA